MKSLPRERWAAAFLPSSLLLPAPTAGEYAGTPAPARSPRTREDSCRRWQKRTAESEWSSAGSCPAQPAWFEENAGGTAERLRWTPHGNGRWPDLDLRRQKHSPRRRPAMQES